MPNINLSPIVKSITIALIFFAVGRLFAIQMGDNGFLVVLGLLVVFYAGWWLLSRRKSP